KDAKSVFKRAKKSKFKIIPVLKKPICIWNNQNYSFDSTHISIPIMVDGKAKKTPIRALLVNKDYRNVDLLKHPLGTLRITKKSAKWIAQIAVTIPTFQNTGVKVMGVDLRSEERRVGKEWRCREWQEGEAEEERRSRGTRGRES